MQQGMFVVKFGVVKVVWFWLQEEVPVVIQTQLSCDFPDFWEMGVKNLKCVCLKRCYGASMAFEARFKAVVASCILSPFPVKNLILPHLLCQGHFNFVQIFSYASDFLDASAELNFLFGGCWRFNTSRFETIFHFWSVFCFLNCFVALKKQP